MKILGIILLVLLILIVFTLVGLLFFPVLYRIKGYYKDSYYIKATISVFYHILGAKVEYSPDKGNISYRIFFFEKHINQETEEPAEEDKKETQESKKEKKEPLLDFLKKWATRIKDVFEDETCKEALVFLKEQAFLLLKVICPKKLKLNVTFSTGSPDTTGQALGILALFPIGYKNRWKIRPDFESEEFYLNCDFDIKGKFMPISVLRIALRVFNDKKCCRLYHRLSGKRGGKRNGR